MGMFSARTTEPAAPAAGGLSIIAAGMTVRGDIDSNGTLKVEGAIEGSITAKLQVLVAKSGTVHGDIIATEVVVGGTVHGAIRADDRVEIQTGAAVHGDITTRRILVAEGGKLNGQIRMGETPAEPRAKDARNQPGAVQPVVRPSVPVARVAVPPRGASY